MSIYILSAPSGAGKTTVSNEFLKKVNTIRRIVTVTTRKPRQGEENGKDYIFISREEFLNRLREGKFLEYAEVYGNLYGTPKDQIELNENEGLDSLLVIDVQGARSIKKLFQTSVSIFLLPPSIDVLLERIKARNSKDENQEERIKNIKKEISALLEFDYIVINDNINRCSDDLVAIYKASKLKREEFLKNPEAINPQILSAIKGT
ncbi:MAG: guanylate kinase [Aquificaceae bacterium]